MQQFQSIELIGIRSAKRRISKLRTKQTNVKTKTPEYKRKNSVQESLLLNGHIAQFRQKFQNLESQRRSP